MHSTLSAHIFKLFFKADIVLTGELLVVLGENGSGFQHVQVPIYVLVMDIGLIFEMFMLLK